MAKRKRRVAKKNLSLSKLKALHKKLESALLSIETTINYHEEHPQTRKR